MSLVPRCARFLGALMAACTIAWTAHGNPDAVPKNRFIIDLQVDPGEEPTHLCVVSLYGQQPLDAIKKLWSVEPDPDIWTFQHADRDVHVADQIHDAVEAMVPGSDELPVCRPRIRLNPGIVQPRQGGSPQEDPVQWAITCRENQQQARDSQHVERVSVLFFDYHPYHQDRKLGPRRVKDIHLNGTVASVDIDGVILENEFVAATPVGGHYAEGHSYPSQGDRLAVPLTLRCRSHDVELPPYRQEIGQEVHAKLWEGEEQLFDVPVTTISRSGRFAMALPYLTKRATKRLSVEVRRTGWSAIYRFEGRWADALPPRTITTRAKEVTFSWHRHCLYPPQQRCPDATLMQVGLPCKRVNAQGNTCRYACGQPERAAGQRASPASGPTPPQDTLEFTLPARVRFKAPTDEEWEDQLSYGGENLRGYLRPDERSIEVDFSTWSAATGERLKSLLSRPDERIEYVQLEAPGQTGLHLKPDEDLNVQRVRVPGVRCGDVLTYRIFGDRSYAAAATQVIDGRIALEPPSRSADDMITLAVALGAGGLVPISLEGGGQREMPGRPFGVIQGIAVIRALPTLAPWLPAIARPNIELRAGFLATTLAFFPLRQPSDSGGSGAPDTGEGIWFSRYPIDAALVWPFNPFNIDVHVGVSGGIVLGHPFTPDEYDVAGGLQGSFSGALFGGYRLGRSNVSVEAGLRVITSEVKAYEDEGFRGVPRAVDLTATSLLIDARLRLGR